MLNRHLLGQAVIHRDSRDWGSRRGVEILWHQSDVRNVVGWFFFAVPAEVAKLDMVEDFF